MSSSLPSSAPPADIEAPLLDKSDYGATSTPQKRSKGAPAAPDRFWTDIAICCGSLVLIVAVFFSVIYWSKSRSASSQLPPAVEDLFAAATS